MFRLVCRNNRHYAWSLLLLALVLGGGGFFWQRSLHQALLDQIDSRLLLTAMSIEHSSALLTPPQIPCERLRPLLELPAHHIHLAIYSAAGDLVCVTGSVDEHDRISIRQRITAPHAPTFSVTATQDKNQRTLLYPLIKDGQIFEILSLGSDLGALEKRLADLRLLLLLASIPVLAIAAFCEGRLRHRQRRDIIKLARLMDATGPGQRPEFRPPDAALSPELRLLVKSCSSMAERMFSELQRARQFSADVTHELRTPLTILRGETELALRNRREPGELHQILESNLEEINRMSYLIEDLLLLSKSDLGEAPLRLTPVNLQELLRELHHQARILAQKKNISVELDCAAGQAFLQADELRLRQVFLNLLTNAIRYTPEQGRVRIGMRILDSLAEISIADNGIGMDSEHLEHIFDRFYRVDKMSKPDDGGTGLGLAIVKSIVAAHQGSIEVSSTPGHGSTFSVTFPLSGS